MLRPATSAPAEVDDEFEREFSQLMLESQGRGAGGRGGQLGGPPDGVGGPTPPGGLHAVHAAQHAPLAAGQAGGATEAVSFKVVMKRGGREDRTRELQIPLTAGMAAHLRHKEEEEAAEKAQLKRLVLEANNRDVQEQQEALRAAQLARRAGPGARGYYGRGGYAGRGSSGSLF